MSRRNEGPSPYQGILVVNKPTGWTSFDVLAKLRGVLGTRGLGHSGTLDPMATGVLPVFVGMARKAVDMQENHDKTYLATMRLGMATDTGDITGTVTRTAPVNVGAQELQKVLPRFLGQQMQLPPMYSAVKVNGQPLYKAARQGLEVERTPRPITVYSLDYMGQAGPDEYRLKIACSKGTYVRVLLEDIGRALGVPATMSALQRLQAGEYRLEDSHTLEEIYEAKQNGILAELLLPTDTVFAHLPEYQADEATVARLMNGAPTYRCRKPDGRWRVYGTDGTFLGLARTEGGTLKVEKLFVERG